ncbi:MULTISPECIES: hypothetical protein [Paenibacillus]|uniref:Uncharacterized protein n=1 Tax=Paenibacillus campinasensis TaxID=66347 RepID=A0A268EZ68_9BACL|nr:MULTISPECIES: hypothetical protein [Paenibacillus]MUG65150.1 hypothetical protein [Paenibacillus campinasensis]PAD78417.1 hypothetical protein CHH67_06550 [Paenibacillus campinasensis]PAK52295.1 hypothetical protein CHH75_12335 [Paenibacillus sp. 7541]
MRRYNIWRPILLIAIALLTNNLVTNVCLLLGLAQNTASDIGFIAMIIAAFVTYGRFTSQNRKRK